MTGFILRAVVGALGLWLATTMVPGFLIEDATTALLAAVLLGLVNVVIRPIAVILTLPITRVTLGLFLWVVNAAMLTLVAKLLPSFYISNFWSAIWGSMIVSFISWLGLKLIKLD